MNPPYMLQLTEQNPGGVTKVTVGSMLSMTYTGPEPGTGVVTIILPAVNALSGLWLSKVQVDSYGRVLSGVVASSETSYIENQTAVVQDASFNVRNGTLINLSISGALNIATPLGVTSGGTGVSTVSTGQVFIGPEASSGAPGFRRLTVADLPAGVLNSDIPNASSSVHGLVRVGSNIAVTDGVISVDLSGVVTLSGSQTLSGLKTFSLAPVLNQGVTLTAITPVITTNLLYNVAGVLHWNGSPVIGPSYSLPVASDILLGGIKIGSGLSIDVDGVVTVTDGPYSLPVASDVELGGIKIGSGLSIDVDGVVTVTGTFYTLPVASDVELGGVKVGAGLSIDLDGVLTVDIPSNMVTTDTDQDITGLKTFTTGISFSDGAPSVLTNVLYRTGGLLWWNANETGSAVVARSFAAINQTDSGQLDISWQHSDGSWVGRLTTDHDFIFGALASGNTAVPAVTFRNTGYAPYRADFSVPIKLESAVPADTTDALYNDAGTLYWKNTPIGLGATVYVSFAALPSTPTIGDVAFLQSGSAVTWTANGWLGEISPDDFFGTANVPVGWLDQMVTANVLKIKLLSRVYPYAHTTDNGYVSADGLSIVGVVTPTVNQVAAPWTYLIGGSIVNGGIAVKNCSNVTIKNIGIDSGDVYTATLGLKGIDGGICLTNCNSVKIIDCVVLGVSTGTDGHGFLAQSGDKSEISRNTAYYCIHGIAVKMLNAIISGNKTIGSTNGLTIKADAVAAGSSIGRYIDVTGHNAEDTVNAVTLISGGDAASGRSLTEIRIDNVVSRNNGTLNASAVGIGFVVTNGSSDLFTRVRIGRLTVRNMGFGVYVQGATLDNCSFGECLFSACNFGLSINNVSDQITPVTSVSLDNGGAAINVSGVTQLSVGNLVSRYSSTPAIAFAGTSRVYVGMAKCDATMSILSATAHTYSNSCSDYSSNSAPFRLSKRSGGTALVGDVAPGTASAQTAYAVMTLPAYCRPKTLKSFTAVTYQTATPTIVSGTVSVAGVVTLDVLPASTTYIAFDAFFDEVQ